MPMYDYHCDDCGAFRRMRPMAESRLAQACPTCGRASERALTVPFLAGGGAAADRATGARIQDGRASWRHLCGFGCSHCR